MRTFIAFVFLALARAEAAIETPLPTLSLEAFLTEVKQKHVGYVGSKAISEGAKKRAEEGDLLFAWSLFGNVQLGIDERPTFNPAAHVFSGGE